MHLSKMGNTVKTFNVKFEVLQALESICIHNKQKEVFFQVEFLSKAR